MCLTALILTASIAAAGCNIIGFAAHVIGGGDASKKVKVSAEYLGLNGKKIAVLVATDEYTLFEHPTAPATVRRSISALLADNLPGVKVVAPSQIDAFQKENPFWNTLPYNDLIQRLQVDRLVYVDLIQYSLHEPGNAYLWQGSVVANVGVAESESPNPGQFAYATTVQIRFPDGPVGMLHGDDQTAELGLLRLFTQETVNRFRDHEVVQ